MSYMHPMGPARVNRYLLPGEAQALVVRQHPALLSQPVTVALGGIFAATVVSEIPHDPSLAKPLAWTLALFLVLRLAYLIANWTVQFLAVTGSRLMLVSGFLSTSITSFELEDLRYCTFQRSFGGRLLGYGTIVFDAGGRSRTLVDFIPFPEQIYLEINGTISPKLVEFDYGDKPEEVHDDPIGDA